MAYFSNSSEGEILDAQCNDCPLGYGWNNPDQLQFFEREPRPCPVALVQLTYNYDQISPPDRKKASECLDKSEHDFSQSQKWLNSNQFLEALEMLIDKDGVCQVRNQLLDIRRQQQQ